MSYDLFPGLFGDLTHNSGFTDKPVQTQPNNVYESISKAMGSHDYTNPFDSIKSEVKPIEKKEKSIFSKIVEKMTSILNAIFSFCDELSEFISSSFDKLVPKREENLPYNHWAYERAD